MQVTAEVTGSFCVCEEGTDCVPHGFLSVVCQRLFA